MRHISIEKIMDYVDGVAGNTGIKLESESRLAIETHLSACSECAHLSQELQHLAHQLRDDAAFEPPVELLQWSVGLFQPLIQPMPQASFVGKVKKIIAELVFDTYDQPLLAGVRRVGATPRQLLFRAGPVDVDVKIESAEAEDRVTLVGQVLSDAARFFDNTPVKLESHGIVRYKTMTNLVGEFSFDEVPKDTYHLSVDLPEGQVTLFCVHRGNS